MKTTPADASAPSLPPRRSGHAVTDSHLKDVYAAWLKDLYDDNPAKVIKSLRRKTSGATAAKTSKSNKQQLRAHATQPTEASASKHISQRPEPKLPLLAQPPSRELAASSLEDAQQRRHQVVANEANCTNFAYHAPFQPGLAFFKLLVLAAIQSSQPAAHSSSGVITTAPAKYEIPSFPVRIPPTLLRFGSSSSSSTRDQLRLALLFTHETSDSAAQVPSGGSNEDTLSSASSFVLFVQVYATERQYREQRKALLRLFITHDGDHQPRSNSSSTISTIMAVSKHASENRKSNAAFLLRTAEDVKVAIDRLWNGTLQLDQHQQHQYSTSDIDGDSDCAIQKYVPFKGSALFSSAASKAWIARPVYRKKDKASWIWIITDSGNSEITDSSCHESCQLVKCIGAQSWSSPRITASTCAHFFENLLKVSLTELVLDLIQDGDGRWWLLQVKAFQSRRQRPTSSSGVAASTASIGSVDHENRVKSAPNRLESVGSSHSLVRRKWRCAGQHCSTGDGDNNNNSNSGDSGANGSPSGYLTKKVLLSCDFYEKYMTQQDMSVTNGFASFSTALSFYLQHQVSKRDRNQLYESQPLCSNCVTKYHFIREQWLEATAPAALGTSAAAKHGGTGNAATMKARKARLLPSLQSAASTSSLLPSSSSKSSGIAATMKASYSTPAFLLESHQHQATSGSSSTSSAGHAGSYSSTSNQQLNIYSSGRPVYLSEMEKIDNMLAEHDTKFLSSAQSKKKEAYEPQSDHGVAPFASYNTDDNGGDEASQFSSFLQKRTEADSVEEMWKSILFKPLASSSGAAGAGGDNRPKVPYNSYSLSNELERQQELEEIHSDPKSHKRVDNFPTKATSEPQRPSAIHHELKNSSGATTKLSPAAAVHTIAISDCKQVFYDETFRERVVSEAKENLLHRNRSVRLVVVPPSIPQHALEQERGANGNHQQKLAEEDDRELAEMVLRSLFLDLSQSAAAATEGKMASSLRKMPTISRESSGCTTMLLTADCSDR